MTETDSEPVANPGLFDEIRERRRDLMKIFGPGALLTFAAFALAFYFVEPPPQRELIIVTGNRDGAYFAVASQYAELFASNGVTLTVRETAGSVENYRLLLEDDQVQAAIVQGGTAPLEADTSNLESIASLYLEPVWVFYRNIDDFALLSQLGGKRIGMGVVGSGTAMLATTLLEANGIPTDESMFISARESASRLKAAELDVAILVASPESPLVRELLLDPEVQLLSMERNHAYSQRFPFLESVILEAGVIDFDLNLPKRPVRLIAPVANLVATSELHDALIPLFLEAATETHQLGGWLNEAGQKPSLDGVEFEVNPVARDYLQRGPSFFQRHMSFWIASLIDRAKIMLVPLVILLIPLIRMAPPVYRWRIRSRIYRWYAILRQIDQTLQDSDISLLEDYEQKLDKMEGELIGVKVPLSYMEEFYNLRMHIDLVQRRLRDCRHDLNLESHEARDHIV